MCVAVVMEVDEMETRILELHSVERAESDEERGDGGGKHIVS